MSLLSLSSLFVLSFVVLIVLNVNVLLCFGLDADGFTWSASGAVLPNSATTYAPLTGPQATIYYYYIYVTFNSPDSTAIPYISYNWNDERVWSSAQTIPDAATIGGASIIDYYTELTAIWTDATSSTLAFCILDSNSGEWGSIMTSDVSAQASPPGLFTPPSAEMLIFHSQASSPNFSYCGYDGYTVFDDIAIGTNAFDNGAVTVNNVDGYTYIFYLGSDVYGNPDGYIHFMTNYPSTNTWSGDMNLGYPVDTDSTLSAVNWVNSTDSYIFVFYKYQGNYSYFGKSSSNTWVPNAPDAFQIGLGGSSGPSVVVYWDSYYDIQVMKLYFTAWRESSSEYRVYEALAIPDDY